MQALLLAYLSVLCGTSAATALFLSWPRADASRFATLLARLRGRTASPGQVRGALATPLGGAIATLRWSQPRQHEALELELSLPRALPPLRLRSRPGGGGVDAERAERAELLARTRVDRATEAWASLGALRAFAAVDQRAMHGAGASWQILGDGATLRASLRTAGPIDDGLAEAVCVACLRLLEDAASDGATQRPGLHLAGLAGRAAGSILVILLFVVTPLTVLNERALTDGYAGDVVAQDVRHTRQPVHLVELADVEGHTRWVAVPVTVWARCDRVERRPWSLRVRCAERAYTDWFGAFLLALSALLAAALGVLGGSIGVGTLAGLRAKWALRDLAEPDPPGPRAEAGPLGPAPTDRSG